MKKLVGFLLVTAIVFGCSFVSAQNINVPQVQIGGSQLIHLKSEIVNQDYDLYINLPRNYSDTTKTFPVLFLLDAQWDFPLVQSLYGEQYYDGFVPDIVIVGITWGGDNPNYDLLRKRDFTPTKDQQPEYSGNAPKFLEFIKKELIPFVESNYRVNNDRALMGSSFGGLFTLYAMFNETESFDKYILTSPALQWGNGFLFNLEKTFSEKQKDINARLFMGIGGYEYVPMLQKFYDLLKERNYQNFSIGYKVINGIGHSGSKADGYTRGLIFAYERPSVMLDESMLEKYTGTYEVVPGINVKVKTEDGKLVGFTPDNNKVVLDAQDEDNFYMKGQFLKVHFLKDADSKITGFKLETYGGTQSAKKISD